MKSLMIITLLALFSGFALAGEVATDCIYMDQSEGVTKTNSSEEPVSRPSSSESTAQ